MLTVYAVVGMLRPQVAVGGLMGLTAGLLNLVLLGQAVRRALQSGDQTIAAASLRSSYAGRMVMQVGMVAAAYLLPFADAFSAILALVFPRIAIMLIQGKETLFRRKASK